MKKQVEFMEVVGTAEIGKRCTLRLSNGTTVNASRVIAIADDYIETKNTIYIKYKGATTGGWQQPQPYQQQVQQPIMTPQYQQSMQQQYQQPQYQQPMQQTVQPQYQQSMQPQSQPTYNQENSYKNEIIQEMSSQEDDPRVNTPNVPQHQNLNDADVEARLKFAKSLKIIGDVDSSTPGT